jgi:hypothetical protein
MKLAGRVKPFIKLFAAVLVLITTAGVYAEQNQPADSQLLQPQALGVAGIFALRDSDANLTGTGVNVAVISRSFTYVNNRLQPARCRFLSAYDSDVLDSFRVR